MSRQECRQTLGESGVITGTRLPSPELEVWPRAYFMSGPVLLHRALVLGEPLSGCRSCPAKCARPLCIYAQISVASVEVEQALDRVGRVVGRILTGRFMP